MWQFEIHNLEQDIYEEFNQLSHYNLLTDRFSYGEVKSHFGVKYEDRLPTLDYVSGQQRIKEQLDKKIDEALKLGSGIDWDKLEILYPKIIPRDLPRGNNYPVPKYRSKKERAEIEQTVLYDWRTTKEYLNNLFPNQEKSIEYLTNKRWGEGIVCPHCDTGEPYVMNLTNIGLMYKCKRCVRHFTARIGTIFQNTKLPMVIWYEAIYLLTSMKTRKISTPQIAKAIGVTQKSAWEISTKIKSAIKDPYIEYIRDGIFSNRKMKTEKVQ